MVDQHTVGNVPKIHDRICSLAHEGGHSTGRPCISGVVYGNTADGYRRYDAIA